MKKKVHRPQTLLPFHLHHMQTRPHAAVAAVDSKTLQQLLISQTLNNVTFKCAHRCVSSEPLVRYLLRH